MNVGSMFMHVHKAAIRYSNCYNRQPSQCRLFANTRKEESAIARALRWMQEKSPSIVLEVRHVSLLGINVLPRPAVDAIRNAAVRIVCLTHADTLSDQALSQQIKSLQRHVNNYALQKEMPTAIFALNLTQASKRKYLARLAEALFGASISQGHSRSGTRQILVFGMPNSGKSSLILPLTKERTLEVRKKKSYHLPKVSSQAGCTLGLKTHVLEPAGNIRASHDVSLMDTPGLRPRLESLDSDFIALLLAAKVIEPYKGYKEVIPPHAVTKHLLEALNRHAEMSGGEVPPYVKLFGLDSATSDAAVFLDAFQPTTGKRPEEMLLVRKCHSGELGGMVFHPARSHQQQHVNVSNDVNDESDLSFKRGSAVVYMNDAAKELVAIGIGFPLHQ